MNIFQDFIKSFNLSNYNIFIKNSKLNKLFYLLFFGTVSFAILILGFYLNNGQKLTKLLREDLPRVVSMEFPEDLTINLDKDSWIINQQEPYYIKINTDIDTSSSTANSSRKITNIVVFDHAATKDNFLQYKSVFVFGNKEIFYDSGDGVASEQIVNITSQLNIGLPTTIDRNKFKDLVGNGLSEIIKLATLPFIICCCLLFFVAAFGNLVYMFVIALIIAVINYFINSVDSKVNLPFSSFITVSIYSLVIFSILSNILTLVIKDMAIIPLLMFVVIIVWNRFAIVKSFKNNF